MGFRFGSFAGGLASGAALGVNMGTRVMEGQRRQEEHEREKKYLAEVEALGAGPWGQGPKIASSEAAAMPRTVGAAMSDDDAVAKGFGGAAPATPDANPDEVRQGQRSAILSNPAAALDWVNQRAAIDMKYGKMTGEGVVKLLGTVKAMKDEGYVEAIALMNQGRVKEGVERLNAVGGDRGYTLVGFDTGMTKVGDQEVPTTRVQLKDREGRTVNLDTAQLRFGLMGMKEQLDAFRQQRQTAASERSAEANERRAVAAETGAEARLAELEARISGQLPTGRSGSRGRGAGGGGGAEGDPDLTRQNQAVFDDIRKEIIQRAGDPNPDPTRAERVPNKRSQELSAHAEGLYRHSVKQGEPLAPAEVAEIAANGQFRTDIVARGEDGRLYRHAGIVIKDPVSGEPRAYFTDKKPVALKPEEERRFTERQQGAPGAAPPPRAQPAPAAAPAERAGPPPPARAAGVGTPPASTTAGVAAPPQQQRARAPRPEPESMARKGIGMGDTWVGKAAKGAVEQVGKWLSTAHDNAVMATLQREGVDPDTRRMIAEQVLAKPEGRSDQLLAAAREVLGQARAAAEPAAQGQ